MGEGASTGISVLNDVVSAMIGWLRRYFCRSCKRMTLCLSALQRCASCRGVAVYAADRSAARRAQVTHMQRVCVVGALQLSFIYE